VRLEGLGKLKTSNDLIGTRSRDLPACSIAPQPATLPCNLAVYVSQFLNMQADGGSMFTCCGPADRNSIVVDLRDIGVTM
jgi:hypothetical protein